jgi:hypothetical protein
MVRLDKRIGGQTMKLYFHARSIRMVGKAGEIRAKLNEWTKSPLTVKQFLQLKGH